MSENPRRLHFVSCIERRERERALAPSEDPALTSLPNSSSRETIRPNPGLRGMTRSRIVQGELAFTTWGGARKGAGRKRSKRPRFSSQTTEADSIWPTTSSAQPIESVTPAPPWP